MTTLREAAQQALECLKGVARGKYDGNAAGVCDALEAALAQQAELVEPVATLTAQRDALLEALNDIANTDPVDAALDPQRAVRIARAAIKMAEESK